MNPLKANEMPHQEPLVRNKNFLEVATGYDAQTAMDEALRCLHCKHKPCISGCPVQIHIPDFIAKVAEGDFEAAYQIISESSSLPAVCGRVCPQERQCESKCVRGIKGDAVSMARRTGTKRAQSRRDRQWSQRIDLRRRSGPVGL